MQTCLRREERAERVTAAVPISTTKWYQVPHTGCTLRQISQETAVFGVVSQSRPPSVTRLGYRFTTSLLNGAPNATGAMQCVYRAESAPPFVYHQMFQVYLHERYVGPCVAAAYLVEREEVWQRPL